MSAVPAPSPSDITGTPALRGREAEPVAPSAAQVDDLEPTEAGLQGLIAGIAPISLACRLRLRAAAPLEARKPQQPCDLGLFDVNARNQRDLFSKLPPGRPDG